MKRSRIAIATALVASSVVGAATLVDAGGNGAPGGPHEYQLNIIGTSAKNPDMTGGNGHRIFVPLNLKSKINLVNSCDITGETEWQECGFGVLDANGTDGDGATFMMPPPGYDPFIIDDPDGADTTSEYSVFVRPLGKPDGWATITTCAQLLKDDFAGLLPGSFVRTLNREGMVEGTECSIEQVGQEILQRTNGKSSFTNVTAELTSVVFQVVYTDGDGNNQCVDIRVPLFDDIMGGEYWEYDNKGLRLAQVRFYDFETNVETGGESTCEF